MQSANKIHFLKTAKSFLSLVYHNQQGFILSNICIKLDGVFDILERKNTATEGSTVYSPPLTLFHPMQVP